MMGHGETMPAQSAGVIAKPLLHQPADPAEAIDRQQIHAELEQILRELGRGGGVLSEAVGAALLSDPPDLRTPADEAKGEGTAAAARGDQAAPRRANGGRWISGGAIAAVYLTVVAGAAGLTMTLMRPGGLYRGLDTVGLRHEIRTVVGGPSDPTKPAAGMQTEMMVAADDPAPAPPVAAGGDHPRAPFRETAAVPAGPVPSPLSAQPVAEPAAPAIDPSPAASASALPAGSVPSSLPAPPAAGPVAPASDPSPAALASALPAGPVPSSLPAPPAAGPAALARDPAPAALTSALPAGPIPSSLPAPPAAGPAAPASDPAPAAPASAADDRPATIGVASVGGAAGATRPATPAQDREPLSAADIGALLARGDHFVALGDIASARLYYERAAVAGDVQAMLALGRTFDPPFLRQARVRGALADQAKAALWYKRAQQQGASAAGNAPQGSSTPQHR